jgi:acyl carrier protein
MNPDQARELMRRVLAQIAPEADLDDVRASENIQEALDLDSVDFLEFVTGLSTATGLEMPERDYAQLSTIEGCVNYLISPH